MIETFNQIGFSVHHIDREGLIRLNRFEQACQVGHGKYSRLMNIQVKPKSDRKNLRN